MSDVIALYEHHEIDPLDALLQDIRRTRGQIAALERITESWLGVNRFGEQVQHPLASELHRKQEHLVKAASLALRAGIEERSIRLTEQIAVEVVEVVHAALNAIDGLTGEQRDAALLAGAARLQLVQ